MNNELSKSWVQMTPEEKKERIKLSIVKHGWNQSWSRSEIGYVRELKKEGFNHETIKK